MRRPVQAAAAIFVACIALIFGLCSYIVSGYERAFEATFDGDSLAQVIARFGEPNVRETPSAPFLRYATSPCRGSCAERLWWEHPILPDMEAWSVEVDASGRVVHKAHWVSP